MKLWLMFAKYRKKQARFSFLKEKKRGGFDINLTKAENPFEIIEEVTITSCVDDKDSEEDDVSDDS